MQRQGADDNLGWTQEMTQDTLVGGPGDDNLTDFLDISNEFAQFDSTLNQHHASSGLDTPMGRLTFAQNGQMHTLTQAEQQAILQNMEMEVANMQADMSFAQVPAHAQGGVQTNLGQHNGFQQYANFQDMHNPYQHRVPPTPVSAEMQGKYASALDSAGQLLFERQNATFTPLVSPAQTPGENPWGMPDYIVADDFFSPLTSPAIEAQQQYTNTTSSPADLGQEMPGPARKPRRKLNPTTRVASARTPRGSPATKGVSRRRQLSMSEQTGARSEREHDRVRHLLPVGAASTAVSSEDSVSPEPLSETAMRPPPIPQSRTPSALRPRSQPDNMPATPATLMRIPGKQAEVINTDVAEQQLDALDDMILPAAATGPTSQFRTLSKLNTVLDLEHDDSSTPTMSAKTPKLSADSTPRSSGMKATNGSSENLTKHNRGGRISKKRQSVSQAAMSPALRPKISPSITPLVPNTGSGIGILSAETSALYLASKSNYQNIIDGTHLPGVSYPENLAENLSSKRTSHKIAEQGRRNRINLALKEIEGLLPAEITAAARREKAAKDEGGDAAEKAAAAQGASKASTVEMAIVYIRRLQAELQETKDKLDSAEKLLAEGHSSGSQTSGDVASDEK